ncbi:methyltransferase domain-containing protein [Terasakiella pusilla]|uniref:methyltransferase domain-containing protein n=1 Tax=Terasakiella pusilla TaxID=64973 RepID=UPI003AA7F105
MNNHCLCCASTELQDRVSFGPQPPSNRYGLCANSDQDTHPLIAVQCKSCGMLQLKDPMSIDMVRSRYEWITYNEPEDHLDDLVRKLINLPGLDHNSRILGLTYKDDSTLKRLNEFGFQNTYRFDPKLDLNIENACAGLETIQAEYTQPTCAILKDKYGLADLLSVRHILEHAHKPHDFIQAIKTLVKPEGYLWFEMPDCSKFIKAADYPFIWEEHITYFSKELQARFFNIEKLELVENFVYPYQFEDSLIGIVKNVDAKVDSMDYEHDLLLRIEQGENFSKLFEERKKHVHDILCKWRLEKKKVAVFGAGHLAVKFINMYECADLIECVIDDHPEKQKVRMPGSGLPIQGSDVMAEIDICLLTLSSESEKRFRKNKGEYFERGGVAFSIFVGNDNSIFSEAV